MENPTHKWKNDQISKNSKIRLKCRMKLIFGCWLGWGIVFFKKKSFLNHWNIFCVPFATFGEITKNDGKSPKCVIFVKFMKNLTHKWKKCQISKNSKIRLKCCMELIFGCWLGRGIVFLKKNHSWTTGTHSAFDSQHLVRPRKMMENHQNDWFPALSSKLARASARQRARSRIFENYEPSPFYRTFPHVHSLPRSFDTQGTADARNHP